MLNQQQEQQEQQQQQRQQQQRQQRRVGITQRFLSLRSQICPQTAAVAQKDRSNAAVWIIRQGLFFIFFMLYHPTRFIFYF